MIRTATTRRVARRSFMTGATAIALFAAFGQSVLNAQAAPAAVTAADYERASQFLAQNLNGLVIGGTVSPTWLDDERFWYVNTTPAGREAVLIDPARATRVRCTLPACETALSSPQGGGRGRAGRAGAPPPPPPSGRSAAPAAPGTGPAVMSPDGKRAAFIRDWNLWVRDVATGQERQLTTDGTPNNGYATDNAGWATSNRAILLWSPDSRKIATQQQDERNVGDWHLVSTTGGHPVLRSWKYPLPGDSAVAMLRRVIIDVDAGRVIPLKLPLEYHRGSLGDNITMNDYNWSPDASKLALVSTSRDHKHTWFRIADAATGDVRTVFDEVVPTHFESRTGWRMLWPTNEVIWYSQRDDWGHLYLYDANTGRLKNRITSGEGPVTQITRIDEKTRTLWFAANGREAGQDPYLRHYYRIGLDGKGYVSLTPDDGDHSIDLSPSGRWIVDTYSKADVPPVVVLRDGRTGRKVMDLEKADISKLVASGWKPPIPFSVKAADGRTDIYGQMFVPTKLDPSKKYPIINNPYPGPQSGSVGSRSFSVARGDRQALAELGFVVVTIDGRGTPGRSKSFHDAYYGAMGRDNTIPDQIAGMKELATRYPYIDIDRVGIWGHSGGGFATTSAMFRFPEFFDVGIAESGNHDQRLYEDDWGERYQGLLVENADGTDNYDAEANQLLAKNLRGKLLLAHGTMDNNVPPENTLAVVDALIKANKDFDLLMIPNAGHGYGSASNYMMRRRWDYFVKNLLGVEPPKEFNFNANAF
ncbi:MAG TPA: DPP IV N-terminal domain-containing protein [Longimicrobiales bacterium]